jgi:hypothetical protein
MTSPAPDVRIGRDGPRIVLITTRERPGKPPKVQRTYLYPVEAALAVALLTGELARITARRRRPPADSEATRLD